MVQVILLPNLSVVRSCGAGTYYFLITNLSILLVGIDTGYFVT